MRVTIPRAQSSGFYESPGTDYTVGQEPELARRLNSLAHALKLHLIGISGYRTPTHSIEVGGNANDPHTRGQASDTPGVEGVPETTLRRFGLTRPFPGAQEADHIQLLGGARGSSAPNDRQRSQVVSIGDLWTAQGGARNLAPTMAAIAMAESGGRVDIVSPPNSDGTVDIGLFQINSSHTQFDQERLRTDAEYNTRAAVEIERTQGLTAWSTYNSGAYRAFMGSNNVVAPSFGGTRPGGGTAGDTGAATDSQFADYQTSLDIPLIPGMPPLPFNPLDIFKGAAGAVKDTSDFLKWIAWIFHPRNILRVVEFTNGIVLMLVGTGMMVAVWKDIPQAIMRNTPAGRVKRIVSG